MKDEGLGDVDELMGLQGEPPAGMLLDVFHATGNNLFIANRVTHVTGLQEVVVGGRGLSSTLPDSSKMHFNSLQCSTTTGASLGETVSQSRLAGGTRVPLLSIATL